MPRSKLREMLDLATMLQASSVGLTVQDMMKKTERSRRTVERMLVDLGELGLKAEPFSLDMDHHLTKRWKLNNALPAAMLQLEGLERSTLETLLEALPSGTERLALSKLLAGQRPAGTTIAVDQETLIERTSHLGRVGPRSAVSERLMKTIEKAIQGFEELDISYQSIGKQISSNRCVQPVGLIFGRFGYLVAYSKCRGILTYRLNMIGTAELTGTYFEYPTDFNLKEWASESFGVFHGDEILTVKLHFSAIVADRAESVQFHTSQYCKRLQDGSLLVTLKCRGHRELFWEMCHPDWAGNVQIQEPDSLIEEYRQFVCKLS